MAIESRKHFELSTYEMDYDHGLATTYETMKYFQELYPNDELFFIMGADLLVDLPNWRQGKELVEGFQFIVMNRDEYDMLKIIAKNPLLRNNNRNFHLLDKGIAMEISSTFIRDEIAMGGDPSGLLPDNCLQYILDNGLYTNAITNKIGLIR
jgi:nicotinate-nucleotide adenylyltransferase